MAEPTQPTLAGSIRTFQHKLHDEAALRDTVRRLVEAQLVSEVRAETLQNTLVEVTTTTSYILRHLAVHLGVGASKAILPLPIGSLLRGSWTAGSRLVETARRSPHANVHSLPVFLVACVPFFGYLAYVIALRRHDPEAAFLYANHISYLRYDAPLEVVLRSKPGTVQKIVRRAVGLDDVQ